MRPTVSRPTRHKTSQILFPANLLASTDRKNKFNITEATTCQDHRASMTQDKHQQLRTGVIASYDFWVTEKAL